MAHPKIRNHLDRRSYKGGGHMRDPHVTSSWHARRSWNHHIYWQIGAGCKSHCCLFQAFWAIEICFWNIDALFHSCCYIFWFPCFYFPVFYYFVLLFFFFFFFRFKDISFPLGDFFGIFQRCAPGVLKATDHLWPSLNPNPCNGSLAWVQSAHFFANGTHAGSLPVPKRCNPQARSLPFIIQSDV